MGSATTNDAVTDTTAPEPKYPTIPRPVAQRLKDGRSARGMSVRGLAREIGVSPSLVSQIENGKANPSVGTLYAMVSVLGISLDELFADADADPDEARTAAPAPPGSRTTPVATVSRAGTHPSLQLNGGVCWERLMPIADPDVDFLSVTYAVGAASCPADALLRHNGREFGVVIRGRLGATVGFEQYELAAGDSIAIESSVPHRLWTIGDEPASVVWTVIGRSTPMPDR